MKKQVKKLSLTTDKIVSLNNATLAGIQGGKSRYNTYLTTATFYIVSNGGQSYNC